MEGGIEAAFKSDLEKSDNPEKLLKEIEERMENVDHHLEQLSLFS